MSNQDYTFDDLVALSRGLDDEDPIEFSDVINSHLRLLDKMAVVNAVLEQWENARTALNGEPSIVARAFASQIRDALKAG